MRARAAAMTHPGCVRARNEDAVVLPGLVLVDRTENPVCVDLVDAPLPFVVIDGLGGHGGGDRASRSVALSILDDARKLRDGDGVAAALDRANSALYEAMRIDPSTRGFGAVAAGVIVAADQIVLFNIGDARVYEYADTYAVLCTRDQRVPASNVVTQSLGGADTHRPIAPNIYTRTVESDVRFLVCSDGLWEILELDSIQSGLATDDPAGAVDRLMRDAIAAGADDNVSILVLDVLAAMPADR